jgi:hypothetical protein
MTPPSRTGRFVRDHPRPRSPSGAGVPLRCSLGRDIGDKEQRAGGGGSYQPGKPQGPGPAGWGSGPLTASAPKTGFVGNKFVNQIPGAKVLPRSSGGVQMKGGTLCKDSPTPIVEVPKTAAYTVTVAALGAPTGSGLTFVKEPKQQLMWFGDATKRKRRYQVSIKRFSEKGAERDFAQQVTNSGAPVRPAG